MPNHLHGIIVLGEREEDLHDTEDTRRVKTGSIPSIVGNFKSLVTRRINSLRRTPGGRVWQRGYYERIIRNAREYDAICAYIQANPDQWEKDPENIDILLR